MLKKKVVAENERQFNQGEAERKAIFNTIQDNQDNSLILLVMQKAMHQYLTEM